MTVSPTVPAMSAEPAKVAVVVPTKNSARTLRACLEALRSQSVACEIVVVDNFSSDETPEIAEELADVVIAAGPERSAQRNVGARATTASIVGFIDSDMIPAPEVVEEAVAAIHAGATGVIVPERTVGIGYWARVRAFERSFYDGSDDIEAARFFSRAAFEAAGAFDEQLTGPEDWDLSDRMRAAGPLVRIEAGICHDEGHVRYLDACRKKAYYAPGLRRYGATKGVASLGRKLAARPWLRQPVRVLSSPLGPGLLALKAGEAVAVLGALVREATRSAGRLTQEPASALQRGRVGTERALVVGAPTFEIPGDGYSATWISRSALWSRRIWRAAPCAVRLCVKVRYGARTLTRIALGQLAPGLVGDVEFHTRRGLRITAPASQWVWWPVFEVVVDDCYRIGELASALGGPTPTVADIGAHIGSFTLAMAAAAPAATIVAYEPSPERLAYLRRNVATNGMSSRVEVVGAAVVDATGTVEFIGDHVVGPKAQHSGSEPRKHESQAVPAISLDDLVARIGGPVDLVKMDCEGSEYAIVSSAAPETLALIRALVLEHHPAPPDVKRQLFDTLRRSGLREQWRHGSEDLGVVHLSRA